MRRLFVLFALFFCGCVSCLQIDPSTQEEYSFLEWAWDDSEDAKCRDIISLTEHIVWQARENFGTNKFHIVVVSVWDDEQN